MPNIKCPSCRAAIEFEIDVTVHDYSTVVYGVEVDEDDPREPFIDEDDPTEEEKVLLADARRLHRAGYDERSAQRMNPDPRVLTLLTRLIRRGARR